MFSKAKGTVAIDPRYTPARNGKDSVIFFRLGCEMTINKQKVTEFYSMKAFGNVADFLNETIKKDSEISIEAIARSVRFVKDGVDTQRTEFHVFYVHDIATNLVVDTRVNEAKPQAFVVPVTPAVQPQHSARSPDLQKRLDADLAWQNLTDNDVKTIGNKFRQTYQAALASANAKRAVKNLPVEAAVPVSKDTATAPQSRPFVSSTSPTHHILVARAAAVNGSYTDMRG
ncbi:single-stranded DNA-binding protein [Morganella morganii]|uniref:single-stranded DNA-binding protein n=1 Tax=Providencia TaxID=586 RepID=UPI00234AC824|nr:single-stranded DNA-binding protein [Providencia sp. PROV255]EMB6211448.1 single-stranded DNA-binding protein [Morganella morganii]